MSMKEFGITLFFLGVISFLRTSLKQRSFYWHWKLLSEYHREKNAGREPSLDQKGAHSDLYFIKYGGLSICIGATFWVTDYFF